jgi:hypothetical protein
MKFATLFLVPWKGLHHRCIYHYTNDAGLHGILKTGKLWFTDIFNLNDPSELKHGMDLALEVLELKANNGPPELSPFFQKVKKLVGEGVSAHYSERYSTRYFGHYFVCCFSKNGNDLGQWRAYADNGRGYSIGFDGATLDKVFIATKTETSLPQTFLVTYDDNLLREKYEELVYAIISAILGQSRLDMTSESIAEELIPRFTTSCLHLSTFFKHKAYANENEYRYMEIHNADQPIDNLLYRRRRYSLIRYREFDWKSLGPGALKEIIIGPAADQKVAEQFVHDCLHAYHPASAIKIERSKIPYRA